MRKNSEYQNWPGSYPLVMDYSLFIHTQFPKDGAISPDKRISFCRTPQSKPEQYLLLVWATISWKYVNRHLAAARAWSTWNRSQVRMESRQASVRRVCVWHALLFSRKISKVDLWFHLLPWSYITLRKQNDTISLLCYSGLFTRLQVLENS